jgi:hypothetical protein
MSGRLVNDEQADRPPRLTLHLPDRVADGALGRTGAARAEEPDGLDLDEAVPASADCIDLPSFVR